MTLQGLVALESMSKEDKLKVIANDLVTNYGFSCITQSSSSRCSKVKNYHYLKSGCPYVFTIIVNENREDCFKYHYNITDLSIYQHYCQQLGYVFTVQPEKDKNGNFTEACKFTIRCGNSIKLHQLVCPVGGKDTDIDHVTGNKAINIALFLRGSNTQTNRWNTPLYCKIAKDKRSFSLNASNITDPNQRLVLLNRGYTINGTRIKSRKFPTSDACFAELNRFERQYFGSFAFNPLWNFKYTWYAFILRAMTNFCTDYDLQEYNRSYCKRYLPDYVEYYQL